MSLTPGSPTGSDRPSRSQSVVLKEMSLLSLLELSNELNALKDLYEIAEVALFNLLGHFQCSRGAFWLVADDPGKDAVLVRSAGIQAPVARAVGAAWTRWFTQRPDSILDAILVSDLEHVMTVPGLDLAKEAGIELFAPVSARKNFLGLVALGKRIGGSEYGALDREVLQASLNLLGVSVENTNLYNRMVENNRRLRRANDQLQDLDDLKSEFLRNMNHELRTPLTIIAAYLDAVIGNEEKGTTKYEQLEIVRGQTAKLHGMLLNLLDFSKLDEIEIQGERSDVVGVLRRFHRDRRPGITADLREFRFSAASDVPPAIFDRARLEQIIDTLVDNAAKFSPQGSLIKLRVEGEKDEDGDDWVRIDVEDNGPGIPAERLPHIFESFRQGDGSVTREHGGMGIGLAFARQLALKMKGRLDVETEIGKGTVFTVRLPTG